MRKTELNEVLASRDYFFFCDNRRDFVPSGGIIRIASNFYILNNSALGFVSGTTIEQYVQESFFKRYEGCGIPIQEDWCVNQILVSLGKVLYLKDLGKRNKSPLARFRVANTSNRFVSRRYEDVKMYSGVHSYHNSHYEGFNNPLSSSKYKIGVELEIEGKNSAMYNEIAKIKSNWFQMEHDSSLNEYGIEFVTIPLLPKDAKSTHFWKRLIDFLKTRAESWSSHRCGLHVHIGKEILGSNSDERESNLTKLLYLYHHLIPNELHRRIFGRESGYNAEDGKTVYGDACKVFGDCVLKRKDVISRLDYEMKRKNGSNRYFDINITNSKTIEFRKGKGSLNEIRITDIVTYCELMCLYCTKNSFARLSYSGFKSFAIGKLKEDNNLYLTLKRF